MTLSLINIFHPLRRDIDDLRSLLTEILDTHIRDCVRGTFTG
jgi:hypothetical protein